MLAFVNEPGPIDFVGLSLGNAEPLLCYKSIAQEISEHFLNKIRRRIVS